MRRNTRSITTSPEIVRHIEGLSEVNFKLLTQLIEWLDANEKAQRKFRYAVIFRLARIETIVQMIHGAQIVEAHGERPGSEEKRNQHTKNADEFIAQKGHEMGLQMVRYIYGEDELPEPRHDRRRRWWGWEI